MINKTFSQDDTNFIDMANAIILGISIKYNINTIRIYRIDNWFSSKWLGFSHKILGAIGVHSGNNLTIPPFVDNRLTAQSKFIFVEKTKTYMYEGIGEDIHHIGTSSDNRHNKITEVAPKNALFWFSGNSKTNNRGSIMGYVPSVDCEYGYWGFYLAFSKNSEWKAVEKINCSDELLVAMIETNGRLEC